MVNLLSKTTTPAELKVGAIYRNWRKPEMIYLITEIRTDRSPEDGEGELIVSYQALYPGGIGGCRPLSDFFKQISRHAGERRPDDPAYVGPRFTFVKQETPEFTLNIYKEKVLGLTDYKEE